MQVGLIAVGATCVLGCQLAGSSTEDLQNRSPRSLFVTNEKAPSSLVVRLLELDGLYDKTDKLSTIVEKTQRAWFAVRQGQGGTERTDLQDTEARVALRDEVDRCAAALYLERKPALSKYSYAVCLGASLSGVRKNLSMLIQAWNEGTRFDSLVFLAGERTLRKGDKDRVDDLEVGSGYPFFKKGWTMPPNARYETEYDLVRLVWDQTELPEDMAQALNDKVFFVNAPRGKNERPGTKDTYRKWIEDFHPAPGTVLAYSYPLLWAYQHLAGETALKGTGLVLDTAAPAASKGLLQENEKRRVSLVFDTVAKCLFEINQAGQKDA